ncbi:MFS transporter [Variovorax sp. DAIF25]|uniref:MFS transporter n=1 Tax=Variovorax sp. DAIF25 TaxID=3080983 RepID=UPI003D6C3FE0
MAHIPAASPDAVRSTDTPSTRLPAGALAWALYEGVRTPYVTLIKVYIFIPYFATVVIGDAVSGQALVAKLATIFSLFAALTSPLLGAHVDRFGARKPWLAAVTAAMVLLIACLWWVKPDGSGLSVPVTCVLLAFISVLFHYSEVLHNSLLSHAAPAAQASATSGLGLALGNGLAVVLLAFSLWAFALPGKISMAFLPDAPLFGLSRALHEQERITAPIVALIFALGAIPLFLLTRDAPKGQAGGGISASWGQLLGTLRNLRQDRRMALFLGSRMVYTDGVTTILVFSGVYAAGVMGWKVLEMLTFAIVVSAFLALGGLLATRLDNAFGAKRAIQIELVIVIACQLVLLGFGPGKILYQAYAAEVLWSGPVFRTLPEILFVLVSCINAMGLCGTYASSRVLLTQLGTPERMAGWFGLYALSGTVTMWLGAALVGLATSYFGTQQAGFVALIGLVVLGLAGLSRIRVGP